MHPFTAVQNEWSLWARHVESDIIPTCRELAIGFVPYSHLGRGFFAGAEIKSTGDIRQLGFIPSFEPENIEKSRKLLARIAKIAEEKECTTNQLALAWVTQKGAPISVLIPGTTKLTNLKSNIGALGLALSPEEMRALEDAVPAEEVAVERYAQISREEQTVLVKSKVWIPETPQ